MAELKPANENPWYVLATLYGEQEGEEIDWALHEKNRRVWNQFVSASFGESKREAFIDVGLAPPSPSAHHNLPKDLDALFASEYMRRNELHTFDQKRPQAREKVEFHGVEFTKRFIAKGMFFPNGLVLDGCCFHDALDLDEAGIVDDFSVIGCRFKCRLSGKSMASLGFFEFANSILDDVIDLQGATIQRDLYFERNVVRSWCVCYDLDAQGDLSFRENRFREGALFKNSKFGGNSNFEGNRFRKETYFSGTVCEGEVRFLRAVFGGQAEFSKVRFKNAANFSEAKFSSGAEFGSAVFRDYSYFLRAKFGQGGGETPRKPSFIDCQFEKPTNFHGAVFRDNYPDLSGAVLHGKTTFTAKAECWPDDKAQQFEDKKERERWAEASKASCAAIRHVLGQQGLPEEEHFFYRREMGFAGQVGSWWARLPYRLFGLVSDYGYSILRPAVGLALCWVVPAFVYLFVFVWGDVMEGSFKVSLEAFGFSFANLFKVFGFQGLYFGAEFVQGLNGWLQFLSALQTIAGVVLLFFLALGLRQRFRLR